MRKSTWSGIITYSKTYHYRELYHELSQSKQRWKSYGNSRAANWKIVPHVHSNKLLKTYVITSYYKSVTTKNTPNVQKLCKASLPKDNCQGSSQLKWLHKKERKWKCIIYSTIKNWTPNLLFLYIWKVVEF